MSGGSHGTHKPTATKDFTFLFFHLSVFIQEGVPVEGKHDDGLLGWFVAFHSSSMHTFAAMTC